MKNNKNTMFVYNKHVLLVLKNFIKYRTLKYVNLFFIINLHKKYINLFSSRKQ